ncbi:MAG: zincin-like metallopeptidase domain-containing protein [Minisyncoccia bacterium]
MKNTNPSNNKTNNVYEIVNNRIIEYLEKGVVPWQQPWAKAGHPKNLISGRNYRGINVWLLNSLGYSQNNFLSFKQVKELGGSVKKDEHGNIIVFWKWIEKENKETKEKEKTPLLRYYRVFNVEQCIDIPKEKLPPVVELKNNPIQTCEEIIHQMPKHPDIRHNENRAYYHKVDDYINVPKIESFKDSQSYYGTLFHEVVHSTGHKERLDRREVTQSNAFGSKDYSVEELTAEMGASYLKSYAGIPIEKLENNAAYIQHWLEKLKKDQKCIVYASAQAQKATDFILNIKNEEKEIEVKEPVKSTEREKELQEMRAKETGISIER